MAFPALPLQFVKPRENHDLFVYGVNVVGTVAVGIVGGICLRQISNLGLSTLGFTGSVSEAEGIPVIYPIVGLIATAACLLHLAMGARQAMNARR